MSENLPEENNKKEENDLLESQPLVFNNSED